MKCNIDYCSQVLTKLCYRIQKNNTKHLVGLCSIHGYRYLEYVPDLDIPIVMTNLKSKKNNGIRIAREDLPQQELL
jgi:Na+-transporting methylmalonyl-CoA/oxaloacetate decarboxylase beta subunit